MVSFLIVWNSALQKPSSTRMVVKQMLNILINPMFNRVQPMRCFVTSLHLLKGLDPNWGSKQHKEKRNIKLGIQYQALQENFQAIEKELEPLRVQVKKQGDLVWHMKISAAPQCDVKNEVQILKAYKKELEEKITKLIPVDTFDRARMNDLIKKRFFYDSSFSIYGGMTGQYDYGPMGCEIIDNILSEWQKHFVIKERMLKINCSSLTPDNVLKASGHVERFVDYVVKDEITGESFRLDHLLKQHFKNLLSSHKISEDEKKKINRNLTMLDGMSMKEMNDLAKDFNVRSPVSGNPVSDATELNLMFPITIGSSGGVKGFLRPETAQGVFVNFKKLLDCMQGKLPFACSQIGNAFRNEILPKSGLLRVREFTMAEIEHFCYPDDKNHPKFSQVSGTKLWLYSACDQMKEELPKLLTIGDAVEKGLVGNETLGFYMARIQQFLVKIGIDPRKLRFRQHMNNEMAHYATDCWDAECLTSYGWTECVGCADRSAFDLKQHSEASGIILSVERPLASPRSEQQLCPVLDKRGLKKRFGEASRAVKDTLGQMDQDSIKEMEAALQNHGSFVLKGGYKVTRDEVKEVTVTSKLVTTEKVIPSVVEPSFGIGRIFYALLEHSFRIREEDDMRTLFAFNPVVAPVKASVLPLVHKAQFLSVAQRLAEAMTDLDLSVWVDDTRSSVGRRYSRTDEVGVPFALTVDEDSLPHAHNNATPSVTLRERDSTTQVRIPIDQVAQVVKRLSEGKVTWQDVVKTWPTYAAKS